jgi:hypothetical protein
VVLVHHVIVSASNIRDFDIETCWIFHELRQLLVYILFRDTEPRRHGLSIGKINALLILLLPDPAVDVQKKE